MVQHEHPGAQLSKDSGDDSGFQEGPSPPPPVILCDSPVTSVESFRFLGTTITQELKWEQLPHQEDSAEDIFPVTAEEVPPPCEDVAKMLVNFYTAIIKSILTSSITVWFAAATARDKAKLQYVIYSTEKLIGCSLS
ncbi:hypothetical protein QTP86_009012 [Hemibagrus guttatus]|nr:hypothetical protein QTP86_009012 [Hemibagrus guttatus]